MTIHLFVKDLPVAFLMNSVASS